MCLLNVIGILTLAALVAVLMALGAMALTIGDIMAAQAEVVAQLQAQKAQVQKIIAEIEALKALVAGTTDVPQAIVDAVNDLGASIQAADDANPDVVPS